MGILTRLIDLIGDHVEKTDELPRRITVTPRQVTQIKKEMSYYLCGSGDIYPPSETEDGHVGTVMGVPVYKRRITFDCPSCGAPAEPNVCSYCKRPTGLIELE